MPRESLDESVSVVPYGNTTALVRHALPRAGGEPYRHSCPLAAFETVANAIEDAGDKGFTLESLQGETGLPFSQVATAMAFLRERSIIEVRYPRRNYAATGMAHLDAVIEYHALREGEQA